LGIGGGFRFLLSDLSLEMAVETSNVRARKGEVDVNELLRKLRLSDAEHDGVVLARKIARTCLR
jgi:hypothetical protein